MNHLKDEPTFIYDITSIKSIEFLSVYVNLTILKKQIITMKRNLTKIHLIENIPDIGWMYHSK